MSVVSSKSYNNNNTRIENKQDNKEETKAYLSENYIDISNNKSNMSYQYKTDEIQLSKSLLNSVNLSGFNVLYSIDKKYALLYSDSYILLINNDINKMVYKIHLLNKERIIKIKFSYKKLTFLVNRCNNNYYIGFLSLQSEIKYYEYNIKGNFIDFLLIESINDVSENHLLFSSLKFNSDNDTERIVLINNQFDLYLIVNFKESDVINLHKKSKFLTKNECKIVHIEFIYESNCLYIFFESGLVICVAITTNRVELNNNSDNNYVNDLNIIGNEIKLDNNDKYLEKLEYLENSHLILEKILYPLFDETLNNINNFKSDVKDANKEISAYSNSSNILSKNFDNIEYENNNKIDYNLSVSSNSSTLNSNSFVSKLFKNNKGLIKLKDIKTCPLELLLLNVSNIDNNKNINKNNNLDNDNISKNSYTKDCFRVFIAVIEYLNYNIIVYIKLKNQTNDLIVINYFAFKEQTILDLFITNNFNKLNKDHKKSNCNTDILILIKNTTKDNIYIIKESLVKVLIKNDNSILYNNIVVYNVLSSVNCQLKIINALPFNILPIESEEFNYMMNNIVIDNEINKDNEAEIIEGFGNTKNYIRYNILVRSIYLSNTKESFIKDYLYFESNIYTQYKQNFTANLNYTTSTISNIYLSEDIYEQIDYLNNKYLQICKNSNNRQYLIEANMFNLNFNSKILDLLKADFDYLEGAFSNSYANNLNSNSLQTLNASLSSNNLSESNITNIYNISKEQEKIDYYLIFLIHISNNFTNLSAVDYINIKKNNKYICDVKKVYESVKVYLKLIKINLKLILVNINNSEENKFENNINEDINYKTFCSYLSKLNTIKTILNNLNYIIINSNNNLNNENILREIESNKKANIILNNLKYKTEKLYILVSCYIIISRLDLINYNNKNFNTHNTVLLNNIHKLELFKTVSYSNINSINLSKLDNIIRLVEDISFEDDCFDKTFDKVNKYISEEFKLFCSLYYVIADNELSKSNLHDKKEFVCDNNNNIDNINKLIINMNFDLIGKSKFMYLESFYNKYAEICNNLYNLDNVNLSLLNNNFNTNINNLYDIRLKKNLRINFSSKLSNVFSFLIKLLRDNSDKDCLNNIYSNILDVLTKYNLHQEIINIINILNKETNNLSFPKHYIYVNICIKNPKNALEYIRNFTNIISPNKSSFKYFELYEYFFSLCFKNKLFRLAFYMLNEEEESMLFEYSLKLNNDDKIALMKLIQLKNNKSLVGNYKTNNSDIQNINSLNSNFNINVNSKIYN